MKKVARLLRLAVVLFVLVSGFIAIRIYTFGNKETDRKADAAIVLGAAVWGNQVSPVFRERINHALDLYRQGKVRKIIFTGGQGNSNEPTEAIAARTYALQNGANAGDLLIEQRSHTTFENLFYAKQVADANALQKVLIVSDPLHMKRAILMAHDIGLDAYPSPTPTTRYQGWRSESAELGRETYYYTGYVISRLFK
jgi:uncharacterized SAM-binding protein YcdF (DUF218 family)